MRNTWIHYVTRQWDVSERPEVSTDDLASLSEKSNVGTARLKVLLDHCERRLKIRKEVENMTFEELLEEFGKAGQLAEKYPIVERALEIAESEGQFLRLLELCDAYPKLHCFQITAAVVVFGSRCFLKRFGDDHKEV